MDERHEGGATGALERELTAWENQGRLYKGGKALFQSLRRLFW